MPITVHPKTSMENDEVSKQLERLYQMSPELSDGKNALEQLQDNLGQYSLIYTAEFNTKVIAAICCSGQGETKQLAHLIVHPANHGRGVEERLIAEVCRIETEQGTLNFHSDSETIQQYLAQFA